MGILSQKGKEVHIKIGTRSGVIAVINLIMWFVGKEPLCGKDEGYFWSWRLEKH